MGTPKNIRFFLMQDFDSSTYYYWNNGVLDTVTDTTIATSAATNKVEVPPPMNWYELEIDWKRKTNYYGVFRSMSSQFNFVEQAASILTNLYLTQGIQGNCVLRIQILTYGGAWSYDDLYVSNIDFSKVKPSYLPDGSGIVLANTLDSELFEILSAYGDTQYNIPMIWAGEPNDPDMEYILTDGCFLKSQYNFTSAVGGSPTDHTVAAGIGTPPGVTLSWAIPSMSNVAPASPFFGNAVMQNLILTGTQIGDDGSGATNLWRDQNYLIKCLDYNTNASDPQQPLSAYLTGGVTLSGTFAFGSQFVAAIIGTSTDGSTATGGTIRSVQILYQKTINSNADLAFAFDDASAGYGTTAPTIFHNYNNPAQITITSSPGGTPGSTISGVADGVIYTLAFGLFGVVGTPPHSWQMTFEYPTTPYPYSTYFQDSVQLFMGGPLLYPASVTPAFRCHKMWEKIVPLMANIEGNYGYPGAIPIVTSITGRSDFLSNPAIKVFDNSPYNTFVTSGNALRQFPFYNYLTTSVNDAFKAFSEIWQLGLGIEGNVLRLEPMSYFFDPTTVIADLTDVEITNVSIEPFTEYMGSNITVGYMDQAFNEYGTLDDYNLSLQFKTPITRIVTKLDKTCPYSASIYQIEKARANQQANQTGVDPTDTLITDSQQDNMMYLLEASTVSTTFTEGTTTFTAWELQRYTWGTTTGTPSSNPSVSGLQYPLTAFNIGLTPKRNFLRNGGLIHSFCHNLDSDSIVFQRASPTGRILTDLLQTYLSTGLIVEYGDETIVSLATPVFLPILLNFDSPQPTNLYSLLNSNPYGVIKVKWFNNIYKGFVFTSGIRPGNKELFTFQLLLTADTDLSKLQLVSPT